MTTHESTKTSIDVYTEDHELEVGTTGWVTYQRTDTYRDLPNPLLRFTRERPEGATGDSHQHLRSEIDAWGATVDHYLLATFVTTEHVRTDAYGCAWVACELTTLDVEDGTL